MGKLTVRFRCCHCGHCCTDVVCLPTPWDVIQLVKRTRADPDDFLDFVTPDKIEEIEKADPTWLVCNGKRYVMTLRRDENGCYFRDKTTGSCRGYEARPILCRLYPFAVHQTRKGKLKSFTLHKDIGCPRCRDGVVATGPMYKLYLEDSKHQRDYADLAEFFNRSQPPEKRPKDFIKLFVIRSKK